MFADFTYLFCRFNVASIIRSVKRFRKITDPMFKSLTSAPNFLNFVKHANDLFDFAQKHVEIRCFAS